MTTIVKDLHSHNKSRNTWTIIGIPSMARYVCSDDNDYENNRDPSNGLECSSAPHARDQSQVYKVTAYSHAG